VRFWWNFNFLDRFSKNAKLVTKDRSVGAELFHAAEQTDGWTDRQTDMTNLKVALRKFANSPNSCTFCSQNVVLSFVWISVPTTIILLYSNSWLDFVTETECLLCGTNWICKCNSGYLSLERTDATFHAIQSELVTMSMIKSQINIRKSSTCVVWRAIVHTVCITLCLSDHLGICCTGSSRRGDLVIWGRGFQLCVPMSIQAWLIWWMIGIACRRETAVTVGL